MPRELRIEALFATAKAASRGWFAVAQVEAFSPRATFEAQEDSRLDAIRRVRADVLQTLAAKVEAGEYDDVDTFYVVFTLAPSEARAGAKHG